MRSMTSSTQQVLAWMREIQENHDNSVFRAKAKRLLESDTAGRAIGALALAALGDAPPVTQRLDVGETREDADWHTPEIVSHARSEIRRSMLDTPCADYDGRLSAAVLDAIVAFSSYSHSGASFQVGRQMLDTLLDHKPLTQLSSDPSEWNDVSRLTEDNSLLWQNKRRPTAFSRDRGATWYDIEDASANHGDILEGGTWRPAVLGRTISGARGRVKLDAYEGDVATKHNGRTGTIARFSKGNAVMVYDGDHDTAGVHHSIDKVEELVRPRTAE